MQALYPPLERINGHALAFCIIKKGSIPLGKPLSCTP